MPTFCDLTTVDFRHFAKVIVRRKKSHSSALRILPALFPTPAKKKNRTRIVHETCQRKINLLLRHCFSNRWHISCRFQKGVSVALQEQEANGLWKFPCRSHFVTCPRPRQLRTTLGRRRLSLNPFMTESLGLGSL